MKDRIPEHLRSPALKSYYKNHDRNKIRGKQRKQTDYARDPEKARAVKYAWRDNNPEKKRTSDAAYYARNKDKKHLYNQQYYQENIESISLANSAYRLAHREALLEARRIYYYDNLDYFKEYHKNYKINNRDLVKSNEKRRRAKKKNAPINDLTHGQWVEIQNVQNHRCYYCGKRCKGKLTQDHIIPLHYGGSHTLHNVIACCAKCNSKKGRNAPPIPVQPLLLTIAPSKKKKE